jgi:hypothetical protein
MYIFFGVCYNTSESHPHRLTVRFNSNLRLELDHAPFSFLHTSTVERCDVQDQNPRNTNTTRFSPGGQRYNTPEQQVLRPQRRASQNMSSSAIPPRKSRTADHYAAEQYEEVYDDDQQYATTYPPILSRGTSRKPSRQFVRHEEELKPEVVYVRARGLSDGQKTTLIFCSIALAVTLFLIIIIPKIGDLFQYQLDNLHYGTPRTYYTDVHIGVAQELKTGYPTHVVIENLHGKLLIIVSLGSSVEQKDTFVVQGPIISSDADGVGHIDIKAADANGDGKPDILVFYGQFQFSLLNGGDKVTLAHQ